MGCGKTFIQREPRDDRIMMEACLCAVGQKVANEAGLRRERINKMQIGEQPMTGWEKGKFQVSSLLFMSLFELRAVGFCPVAKKMEPLTFNTPEFIDS